MNLRWGVGLPGPFTLSGRVLPRRPRPLRPARSNGLLLGLWWMLAGVAVLTYWMYLGLIGVAWWAIASVRRRGFVAWPVPARAWTFWRRA